MEQNYYDLWLKALSGIVDTVQKGLDVAPQYVVELVHRYWWYAFVSWLAYSVLWAVIIYLGYKTLKRWIKFLKEDWEIWWIAMWAGVIIIWVFMFMYNLDSALEWLLLPEVSLIDHFTPNCNR